MEPTEEQLLCRILALLQDVHSTGELSRIYRMLLYIHIYSDTPPAR